MVSGLEKVFYQYTHTYLIKHYCFCQTRLHQVHCFTCYRYLGICSPDFPDSRPLVIHKESYILMLLCRLKKAMLWDLCNGWTFLKYWGKKILFLFISVAENIELSQHLTSLNLISILMLSGISYPNLDTLVSQATCGEGWHPYECGIPMHTYLAKWLILRFLPLVFRILSL